MSPSWMKSNRKTRQRFTEASDRGALTRDLRKGESVMADVVKVIEVLAESNQSWEDAAAQALKKASQTLKNIRSIYIKDFEAKVDNNRITQYRINAKISFLLD
jgi:flavin-binding protein dodecin